MQVLSVMVVVVLGVSSLLQGKTFVLSGWRWPLAFDAARQASFPYISGDTLRSECDFVIDEKQIPFDPSNVKHGDTIFINPGYGKSLEFFFTKIHPLIKSRYILVTHNGDKAVPGNFVKYLHSKKIVAWFGVNADGAAHPKMVCLPIGIANQHWPNGNIELLSKVRNVLPGCVKDNLLYMNFSLKTNMTERTRVQNLFRDAPFCKVAVQGVQHQYYQYMKDCGAGRQTGVVNPCDLHEQYLYDVAHSKFVLSPQGNGIDCYRTWEALLLGAVPIVKHSVIDPVFAGLPVLLIDDWQQVTQEFLEKEYAAMHTKTWCMERLFADYWIEQIQAMQHTVRVQAAGNGTKGN